MTYAQKYGRYGIYTDGMLYKWFKDIDRANDEWNKWFADPECSEDWLEEYDEIQLVDMKNGNVITEL